jgi:hypothetical protein
MFAESGLCREGVMPMRGELLVPTAQSGNDPAADQDAWLVVGFCLIGLAVTAYFLIRSGSADNLGALVAQATFW